MLLWVITHCSHAIVLEGSYRVVVVVTFLVDLHSGDCRVGEERRRLLTAEVVSVAWILLEIV